MGLLYRDKITIIMIMRIIDANVVRGWGHLSENYLTRKFIARNIHDLRCMTCYVLQAGGVASLAPCCTQFATTSITKLHTCTHACYKML